MRKSIAGLIVAMVLVCLASAQQKPSESTSDLKFTVVKDFNGKPVRNASVILHTIDKKGKQDKGGLQTKTDAEGHCAIPAIPYGKLRVQVNAKGFQTFGQDYDINQPTHEFTIKLKFPQEQYSIYK